MIVEEGILPAEAVLPVARVIEKIFIGSADLGPRSDHHAYWQGRLLQPMALTFGKLQRPDEHLDRFERATAIFADLAVRNPGHVEYRRRLARSHQMAGEELAARRRHPEALLRFAQARLLADSLLADEPDHWRWRWYVLMAHQASGLSSKALSLTDEARAAFALGRPIAASLHLQFPDDAKWQTLVTQLRDQTASLDAPAP